ncbi:methoprene-tolerant [Haematobia irritans]|uniref:methoprene-tolerant n=1 Tax=Haematobia irritans TaxID=7368 RepID=UPI003F504EC3
MDIMPSQSIVHHPYNAVTVMANSSDNSTPTSPVAAPTVSPSGASADSNASSSIINGREARNLAEKQRRDKLNASINELAKMVPHVADCPRRLDKTAVLRFATHGLRLQYVFGKTAARKKKLFKGDNHNVTDALLQLIDSFFITLTCHGQIVLISSSVENLLGHCQADLYGQNLLQITHPEDHELLRQQLIPSDIESLFMDFHGSSMASHSHYPQQRSYATAANSAHQQHTQINSALIPDRMNDENHLKNIDDKLREDKRSFTVRLARASTRTESKKIYEIVKIDGCFRRSDFSAVATGANSYPIVSQLIRRSRNATSAHMTGSTAAMGGNPASAGAFIPHLLPHDAIAQAALHGVSGNDIVLVAMARIIRPAKLINWPLEANRLEYKTRHLIDGRIIDCDHRIGLVAGYLQEEVRNLSPFSFMHQDDVRWVIVALRQMYDCNSDTGESCYRLLSRNGNFIYLRTRGYLEIDRATNKVHSFVCINTLLDEEEGKRKVQEMKNKFSIIINAKIPTGTMQDATASHNPQQLEKIVLYLIENLQKRQTNSCVVDEIHSEDDVQRHTSTPPLALVPPEPASVKNSISKSVSVVIATAAKSIVLKSNDRQNSTEQVSSSDLNAEDTCSNAESTNMSSNIKSIVESTSQQRPSVLQMHSNMCQENSITIPCSTPENIPETAQQIKYDDEKHKHRDGHQTPRQHVSVLKRLHIETEVESCATSPYMDDDCGTLRPSKCSSRYSSSSFISSDTMSSPHSSSCISPAIKNDNSSDFHSFISSNRHDVVSNKANQGHHGHFNSENKMEAILMEQERQQQQQNIFLVNIKNEYEEIYQEHYTRSPPNRTEPDRDEL